MNFRATGAVILGIAAWPVLFTVVGVGFGLLWSDYRLAARTFFASQNFSQFTLGMMLLNFVLFTVIGAVSGWLVARVGASRTAGLVFAGICFAYGALNHFYLLWGNLPDWYNLAVPWIMAGSIVIGVRQAKVKDRTPDSTASQQSTPSAGSPADR